MTEEIQTIKPNFGITLDELICFKSRPKSNPKQNQKALELAIQGLEFFEVPSANLGTSLELLEEIKNPVEILSYFVGLGKLLTTGSITYKGQEISYDDLLNEEPHLIVSRLVGYGHNFNAINIMKRKTIKKGFPGRGHSLLEGVSNLFKERKGIKENFIFSLEEAKKSYYPKDDKLPLIDREHTDLLQYLQNLVNDLYSIKNGKEYLWQREGEDFGLRLKTRSTSPGREGALYFTWKVNGLYYCTCPATVKCKHIKYMEQHQNQ